MIVTLEEAQARLAELVHRLLPGEELTITENDQPVAKLIRMSARTSWPSEPGSARKEPKLGTQRGSVLSMEHFDDPLEDFEE